MAKRAVVEIECGRCTRKEYRDAPSQEPGAHMDPVNAFSATLNLAPGDRTIISFEDLCTPCMNTVKGHLDAIGKKIEGVSPVRQKRAKKEEEPTPEPVQIMETTPVIPPHRKRAFGG